MAAAAHRSEEAPPLRPGAAARLPTGAPNPAPPLKALLPPPPLPSPTTTKAVAVEDTPHPTAIAAAAAAATPPFMVPFRLLVLAELLAAVSRLSAVRRRREAHG